PQGAPGEPILQAALNAAQDGDVLLVRAGTYTGVTQMSVAGKGVTVINDSGAPLQLSPLGITGVPASSTFAVRGITITAQPLLFAASPAAIAADQCAGTIWLEDCVLNGASGMVVPF